jgi:cytochrome c oxidase cbb3-type subunit 3
VHNGVKEKGMIAWGALLNKKEILSVSAYVRSLRGRTPPNAKAPQGTKEEANPHH